MVSGLASPLFSYPPPAVRPHKSWNRNLALPDSRTLARRQRLVRHQHECSTVIDLFWPSLRRDQRYLFCVRHHDERDVREWSEPMSSVPVYNTILAHAPAAANLSPGLLAMHAASCDS